MDRVGAQLGIDFNVKLTRCDLMTEAKQCYDNEVARALVLTFAFVLLPETKISVHGAST